MFIPNTTKVKVIQYRPDFIVMHSISKRPFYGNLEIEFYPENKLLEFAAFEGWLSSLSTQEFTIESLCDVVFDKITNELGFTPLSVMVNARTSFHNPVSAARIRTAEDIRKNPVMKSMKERRILVPGTPIIPDKIIRPTKRGKR